MLPKQFKFSAKLTFFAVALSILMLWASSWQWDRYLYKVELVKTYSHFSDSEAAGFPVLSRKQDYDSLIHHKVKVRGEFDLENQLVIINRRHSSGSGYWLMAPFRIAGSDKAVMVSRGFIPFEDRAPDTWRKYDQSGELDLIGVLQESEKGGFANPDSRVISYDKGEEAKQWRYPDLDEIAKGLPYKVVTFVFIQRLGPPEVGEFPAEAISIRVPPSTHYWYSIEWKILAFLTLLISFFLQAFPRRARGAGELFVA